MAEPAKKPNLILAVLVIVALAVIGGIAWLATMDLPPPAEKVEKVVPDDRFPR